MIIIVVNLSMHFVFLNVDSSDVVFKKRDLEVHHVTMWDVSSPATGISHQEGRLRLLVANATWLQLMAAVCFLSLAI